MIRERPHPLIMRTTNGSAVIIVDRNENIITGTAVSDPDPGNELDIQLLQGLYQARRRGSVNPSDYVAAVLADWFFLEGIEP